jgi:hypothetical protein
MGRVTDAGNKSYGAVRIGDWANLNDGEKITISRTGEGALEKVFEFDDDAAVADGSILVDLGADAEEAIENLKDAINAQLPSLLFAYVDPVDVNTCRIEGLEAGDAGNLDFTHDMTDPQNIIAAIDDALAGGAKAFNLGRAAGEYIVTALDVLAENVMIPLPFQAPVSPRVFVRSSADVPKYISDKVKITSTRLQIEKNGATNLAEGDKVDWEVYSAT